MGELPAKGQHIPELVPQQAQGQQVDARSDIFSFGLVLYEMLSGKRAFSGDSPMATAAALIRDEFPPLQASSSLEIIVQRCLAKLPSARYQTMSEVKTMLEQISGEMTSKNSIDSQPSIAVLPFVNMSGDKEQEYFSDGLAEEIINTLAQIPGLKVTARTSAFAFKGKQEDIRKIAELLGVTNILEGSVRKAGNRIRVTAQLISAADGNHIWSERLDREMTDVFAIQDEISQAIADKLRVKLAGGRSLVKRQTENLEAFNLYLKGIHYLNRPEANAYAKCKECFEQAIAIDPKYAKAWYGLAYLYWVIGVVGVMPAKAANAQCVQAVHKALVLDEMLPEAHAIQAALRAAEFDWTGAEREFRRALELGPEVSDVWLYYSMWCLVPKRRLDEALVATQKALELDPLSPFLHLQLGARYFQMRQYDRSMLQARSVLELDPQFFSAYTQLSYNFIQIGNLDEAVRAMETAARHLSHLPLLQGLRGFVYGRAGRIGDAQKLLEKLHELAVKAYVPATAFAAICYGLGEIEKCFDWLDKAVDERDPAFLQVVFSPLIDPLLSHPRYHALLRKMNLEP